MISSRLQTKKPSLRVTLTGSAVIATVMLFHLYLEYLQSSYLLFNHDMSSSSSPRTAGSLKDENRTGTINQGSWSNDKGWWDEEDQEERPKMMLEYERLPALKTANNWTCLLLHGLGDHHASDSYALRKALIKLRPTIFEPMDFIIPVANTLPISVFDGLPRPAWFDIRNWSDLHRNEDLANMRLNVHRLRHIINHHHLDLNRTIIAGFSQGAVMSLLLGLSLDRRPAAIIMLSGYLPIPSRLDELFGGGRSKGEGLGTTKVHWLHGAKDPYFPLSFAQNGFQTLQNLALFPPQNLSFSSIANLDHRWSADELDLLAVSSLDPLFHSSPSH